MPCGDGAGFLGGRTSETPQQPLRGPSKAKAGHAYARQCKNKDLEADAFEIRKRAERLLRRRRSAGAAPRPYAGVTCNSWAADAGVTAQPTP